MKRGKGIFLVLFYILSDQLEKIIYFIRSAGNNHQIVVVEVHTNRPAFCACLKISFKQIKRNGSMKREMEDYIYQFLRMTNYLPTESGSKKVLHLCYVC